MIRTIKNVPIYGTCVDLNIDGSYNVPKCGTVIMNLLGRNKADLLRRSNKLFDKWLCTWLSELKAAYWKDSNEVSRDYPTIKKLENDEFIFRAGDSGVFVKVMISFQYSSVLILDIKEDC